MAKGGLMFRDLGGFKGANPLNPLIFFNFWVKRGQNFSGFKSFRGLNIILEYDTIFVNEIWTFSEMVPFLLRNLRYF